MSEDPRVTGEMTFLQHLEELRKVLMQAAPAMHAACSKTSCAAR